jgi:NAD(P)-dependent dehydrogenase (short-subunit alcohol dehydrogenase family)
MIDHLTDIKGFNILITGASGNLGTEFSHSLARLGANLILIDKDSNKLKKLKLKLSKNYQINIDIYVIDLEKEKQRVKMISNIIKNHSLIDVIINNAAFVGSSKLKNWSTNFENQSIQTWNRAIEVNLTSVFHICQGLLPLLKISKNASIINIGSMHGFLAPEWSLYKDTDMSNPAAYSVSKAGIIHLTKWLATTLSPDIRVNCISPGGIFRNQPKKFLKRFKSTTPLKKMAEEKDIIGALIYLCSRSSSYVTGQNIIIDGGRSLF